MEIIGISDGFAYGEKYENRVKEGTKMVITSIIDNPKSRSGKSFIVSRIAGHPEINDIKVDMNLVRNSLEVINKLENNPQHQIEKLEAEMKTAMQDMLLKLANGQELFDCKYSDQKRKCKILKLDFETERVFVKFDKPVKKTIRVEGNREDYWGLDKDDDVPMVDKEIESIEEWISI